MSFEHEALQRRRAIAVLEGIAIRSITIKCSAETPSDDGVVRCDQVEVGYVDEATTAKAAYGKGWRSEDVDGQEARGALCPAHAKERGRR